MRTRSSATNVFRSDSSARSAELPRGTFHHDWAWPRGRVGTSTRTPPRPKQQGHGRPNRGGTRALDPGRHLVPGRGRRPATRRPNSPDVLALLFLKGKTHGDELAPAAD